ncbi:hypothetical protein AMECASPLE_032386 [Ameca splendens]|uniref:Uncharacterized protein n=1 Tax=Ameca splendens TaxID=208324 RepID=A0ABV0Y6I7_9TELE
MDEPVLPFLCKDLTEMMVSLERCFIKRELLQVITPFKLTKLDPNEQKNCVSACHADIGLGAESVLKVMLLCNSLTAFSLSMATARSFSPSNPWISGLMFFFIKLSIRLILSCRVFFNACCSYLMAKLQWREASLSTRKWKFAT